MLPSASALACRREERIQKAVSVDHHGPGDARLSAVLNPLSGARCDYVGADADAEMEVDNLAAGGFFGWMGREQSSGPGG